MKKAKTKHIYSLELPQEIFDKCSMRNDITSRFVNMIRGLK